MHCADVERTIIQLSTVVEAQDTPKTQDAGEPSLGFPAEIFYSIRDFFNAIVYLSVKRA